MDGHADDVAIVQQGAVILCKVTPLGEVPIDRISLPNDQLGPWVADTDEGHVMIIKFRNSSGKGDSLSHNSGFFVDYSGRPSLEGDYISVSKLTRLFSSKHNTVSLPDDQAGPWRTFTVNGVVILVVKAHAGTRFSWRVS